MSGHLCLSPGCDNRVPRSQLACRAHWFVVPQEMRDELWSAYRNDGMGSERHTAAVRTIVLWLADR